MPKYNWRPKREERELPPEMLYGILYKMWGNDVALEKFKEMTGEDYKGNLIEEPDWSGILEVEEDEKSSYDDAIIGVTHDDRVIYDYDKMIDHLVESGMSVEDAVDYISYDTIRALGYWPDGKKPIVMFSLEGEADGQ